METPPLLRSLAYPNFRRYCIGQLVSLSGSWMQHTAQAWLVYRLTESSLWLGLVAFVGMSPILLLGIPAGHLADRLPRHRLLLLTNGVALLHALLLAVLTLTGTVTVGTVLGLAVILGCTQALEMPTRHSFIPSLVPRDALPNAIALNSGLFNASRFIGPAVAGVLIAAVGEGWAFLVNSVSFLAMIVALLSMDAVARSSRAPGSTLSEGFWAGPRYVMTQPALRRALQMVTMASLVGLPFSVLLPAVVRQIHGGGPTLLGMLMAANGAGAFVAAGWLALRGRGCRFERVIGSAAVAAGAALLLFSTSTTVAAALPLLALTGCAFTVLVASCNTAVQMRVPDRLRGRVMALYGMLFVGMFPIGNLVAGSLGELLGVRPVMALFGGCCAVGGALFLLTRRTAE